MTENRSIILFNLLQQSGNVERQFEEIMQKCKMNKTKFDDSAFYPNKEIKSADKQMLNGAKWKRLEDLYKNDFLDNKNISPDEIGQGTLGNCYLIVALIYIAQYPEIVKTMFHPKSDFSLGIVLVYFTIMGEKLPVIVDTKIPFYATNEMPVFAQQRGNSNPSWFMLIEKAYAKACGGYSLIESGQPHVALHNFFGWYGEVIDDIKESYKLGDAFQSLLDMRLENAMVGSSVSMLRFSKNNSPEDVQDAVGLIVDHSYQILDAREVVGGLQFVKLRNPWGKFEWTGDFSNDDTENWTEQLKNQLGYTTNAKNGSFWMLYSDFEKYFTDLSYSLPDDEKMWTKKYVCGQINGYLDQRAACGGGLKNAGCLPQWKVTFSQRTLIRIHVEIAGPKTFHGLNLVYNNGERVQTITADSLAERDSNNSSVNGFQYFIEHTEYPWTIFLDRPEGSAETSYFRIVIECPSQFTVSKFEDFHQMKSFSGSGIFRAGRFDGWNPHEDKAITPCRQWYFKFQKPTVLHVQVYKSISEKKHDIMIGYTNEKMSMAYQNIDSKHYNLNAVSDFEEIHFTIDKIEKYWVLCIYREKSQDSTKFKFIAYCDDIVDFGELPESEDSVPKEDAYFTNISPIIQPENFSPPKCVSSLNLNIVETQCSSKGNTKNEITELVPQKTEFVKNEITPRPQPSNNPSRCCNIA